jgi:hypothetical protein
MAVERTTERLRTGLRVQGDDGQVIGTITDVWADVGVGESWGAVGALPIEGAEAADPVQYAFCEATFSYVSEVRYDTAVLSLAASDVPAMQWDVRPDFLATRSVPDSGAPSNQA